MQTITSKRTCNSRRQKATSLDCISFEALNCLGVNLRDQHEQIGSQTHGRKRVKALLAMCLQNSLFR